MIVKFWKMLNSIRMVDRLPKLPNGFYTPFDEKKLDENGRFILSAARAADPDGVRRYLEENQALSAFDVVELFQAPPKPARRRRFKNWIMRLLGESSYDVVISQYFRQKRLEEKGLYMDGLNYRKGRK